MNERHPLRAYPEKNTDVLPGLPTLLSLSLFFLFTIPALAQQSPQLLHHHVQPVVASGQALPVGVLPPSQQLHLAITLPLRNPTEMNSLLQRLYDPKSPDYRHYLSVAQFTRKFGPTQQDYQAVVAFAKANGFTVINTAPNRLVVDVTGSVEQVERAFHVAMILYQHPTENRTFYSTDREPSLDLSVPVAHISGLNNFVIPRPKVMQAPEGTALPSRTGSGPGGQYLGSDMRAAYYGSGPLNGAGQTVGLFEFDGYNIADVTSTLDGQTNSVPINNVLLDGASAGSDGNDTEQVLDIVQVISMAPGLSQLLVYIAPGGDSQAVDILNRMASDNIAKQLSCSFGFDPDASTIDPIFQEMAIQGQTFLTASGDNGAIGPGTGGALVWPADDAFQVGVGGTDLTTNGAGGPWQAETAWIASAGGITDNGVNLPFYQVGVANASNAGSNTLRNVPDVAAEANFDNYVCHDGSCGGGWGGTSFAAPRWAGYIALANQQAALVGFPPVGFINPAVYAIGEGSNYNTDFHDITSGNNDCCGQSTFWTAVTGYDLVTGWGSPNGPNLIYGLVRVLPPTITSGNSTTFTVGSLGSFQVTATGFPTAITFSHSGTLPGGVTLSPSGLLSGMPAAGGIYPITITASNGVAPDATQTFTLTVDQAPTFTSANHTTFTTGTFGSFTVTAAGFPTAMTFSFSGTLPNNVTLSPSGVLSGIPAAGTGGIYAITITASNGIAPNATQTFTLTVDQAPTITSANNTTFTIGMMGSFQVTATGFPTSMTFTESGPLPNGVNLSPSGLLSGIPAAGTAGTYNIIITASNGVAPNGTQSFTLTVVKATTACETNRSSVLFTNGQVITFTGSVTWSPMVIGSPTGTVTFYDTAYNHHVLGTAPLVGGTASINAALTAPPDVQFVKADYAGDASFKPCVSKYVAENHH